jgi:hypothetical protein
LFFSGSEKEMISSRQKLIIPAPMTVSFMLDHVDPFLRVWSRMTIVDLDTGEEIKQIAYRMPPTFMKPNKVRKVLLQ